LTFETATKGGEGGYGIHDHPANVIAGLTKKLWQTKWTVTLFDIGHGKREPFKVFGK
jgi:hypothetical protein